jgi:hypothetical protein
MPDDCPETALELPGTAPRLFSSCPGVPHEESQGKTKVFATA